MLTRAPRSTSTATVGAGGGASGASCDHRPAAVTPRQQATSRALAAAAVVAARGRIVGVGRHVPTAAGVRPPCHPSPRRTPATAPPLSTMRPCAPPARRLATATVAPARRSAVRRGPPHPHAARPALLLECDGVALDAHADAHRVAFNRAFSELGMDW